MTKEIEEELLYRIALTQIEKIGYRHGRKLLNTFGSAKSLFNAPFGKIKEIEGIGEVTSKMLLKEPDMKRASIELAFILKHNIQPLFLLDDAYPDKLRDCYDAPIMLYYKGNAPLNKKKIVAVIGSRGNTEYGARMTEELIEGLKDEDVLIVSGLAFGIDSIAHRKALQVGLPTIGVVAHGLDVIYPSPHKSIAKEMIKQGGLLTEYTSMTAPDRYNFPMRNRIVAGLSDVIVVTETATKGGAMITAKLATSYGRDVAAFPGRTIDKKSEGCNYLIKTCIAQMITSTDDLLEMMNWQPIEERKPRQRKLFTCLTDDEMKVAGILDGSVGMHIDELLLKSRFSTSRLSSLLLSMELNSAIKSLPGKRFKMLE